ncbi:MAG: DNA-3-methyladenine glycosylase [Chitinophagaceae bacterium]|nr:DNA-3-methyladenine glycosylase [Chitinophagaceae bacterium]
MKKLPISFYNREDVVLIAKELLGKILVTKFNNTITSGIIVETEAYIGITDNASHSYNGKRTLRNEMMYAKRGVAYVYICYGMHHLFNVVTNKKNIPDAVLIRAIEPLQGIDTMLKRTGKKQLDSTLTKGPGNVGKALGISKEHSGLNLLEHQIFIGEDEQFFNTRKFNETQIGISKRIGVESAGIAANYPYRFYVKGNKFVSSYPNK